MAAISIAILIAIGVYFGLKSNLRSGGALEATTLRVMVPFVFSEHLRPTEISTVGDQTLSEHLFGFHARTSLRSGFEPLLSFVDIDRHAQTVRLRSRYDVKRSDGTPYTMEEACGSLAVAMKGSSHFSMTSIVKGAECHQNTIELRFSKIPSNIRYLLTLPDFSMEDANSPPLSSKALRPTTGPYYLTHLDTKSATLRINPYYPNDLRANTIPEVQFSSFPASAASQVIMSLNQAESPIKPDFIYFYGFALTPENVASLEQANYNTEIFSTEWIVLLSMHEKVPITIRRAIARAVDGIRDRIGTQVPFAQAAYSTSPQDRPFGMSEEEYKRLLALYPDSDCQDIPAGNSVTLEFLDEWESVPVFKMIRDELAQRCPFVKFQSFRRPEMGIRSRAADVLLTPFGQSPADPLPNLGLLARLRSGFQSILKTDELAELASVEDAQEFARRMKGLNQRIHSSRLIIPVAHFPGVVASSKRYARDEKLSFDWGIQTWTYRPN